MGDADDSDRQLLARVRAGRDAHALAEIVRRHAGLVHGACQRRAGAVAAAGLTARIFADLSDHPEAVSGALPLWLHAAALTHSAALAPARAGDEEAEWSALAPAIDAAIAALAPLARLHLLLAFATRPARGHEMALRADLDPARAQAVAKAVRALAAGLGFTGPVADLAALLKRNLIAPLPPAVAGTLAALALRSLETSVVEGPRPRIPTAIRIAIAGVVYVILIAIVVQVVGWWAAERRQSAEPPPAPRP